MIWGGGPFSRCSRCWANVDFLGVWCSFLCLSSQVPQNWRGNKVKCDPLLSVNLKHIWWMNPILLSPSFLSTPCRFMLIICWFILIICLFLYSKCQSQYDICTPLRSTISHCLAEYVTRRRQGAGESRCLGRVSPNAETGETKAGNRGDRDGV